MSQVLNTSIFLPTAYKEQRMSSVWDFFDRRVCLTTVDEEWCAAQSEFARVGLDGYQKFLSLSDIGPHQSFSKSCRAVLREFYESGAETLLFIEDDCVFRPLDHLGAALLELPEDWDIVYLGANLICWGREDDPKPERYSEHLFRVRQAWTTHCVGFNRKVVPFLLENQPGFSERMFDNALSEWLPNLQAFVVAPMIAYQRPHYSTIWKRFDDYTPIFEASQELLK